MQTTTDIVQRDLRTECSEKTKLKLSMHLKNILKENEMFIALDHETCAAIIEIPVLISNTFENFIAILFDSHFTVNCDLILNMFISLIDLVLSIIINKICITTSLI